MYPESGNNLKAGTVTQVKRQSPAKAKKINCDKEGISLMLKVSIHYMAVINTYAPNNTLHYLPL